MLTSTIDFHASDVTLEERIFVGAKRVCIVFAVAALAISALDLMNVRSVEAAAEFIHDRNLSMASLREGLQDFQIPMGSQEQRAQITVAIPRDVLAEVAERMPLHPEKAAQPGAALARMKDNASVDALAAARHEDAIMAAMAQPTPPQPTLQLASIDATSLPREAAPASAVPEPIQISLPAMLAVLPPPAPGVPPPSPIDRLHLQGKSLARAERCLANAVYFEARDQPFKGQVAVAQVVMNRVFSGFYPEDVCGVIYQNADHHLACQFTFACDGKRKTINERGAWARANRISKETLAGKLYEPAVGTATHYHALYVHPNWVREMHKLVRFGIHSFYRPIAWGNGSDEPIWSKLALKKTPKN